MPLTQSLKPLVETVSEFRIRYIRLVLVLAITLSSVAVIEGSIGLLPMGRTHILAYLSYIGACFLLIALLWQRPNWFRFIAYYHTSCTFLLFVLDLYWIPTDEIRFLWLYVHVGGTFMLLGSRAGWLLAGLSVAIVVWSGMVGLVQLSPTGAVTFSIGLLCAGAMFHTYNLEGRRLIESRDAALASLNFAAHHDALTGLPNLVAFRKISTRLADLADRTSRPYSILFLDIDRFKLINDQFGHGWGDVVLSQIAAKIGAAVRASDVVARIGGEEFIVMLPETEATGAAVVAEKIRAAIEAEGITVADQRVTVTVSIGRATSCAPHDHIDTIIQSADEAMYRAKQAGRNCVMAAATGQLLV